LNAGLERGLTLISAPAGFGKTTLLAEWIASCDRPVAWLSLDQNDSDLMHFLTYLIAALQTIDTDLGANVLKLIHSPQAPSSESILITLINQIANSPASIVLVLDDFHLIDSPPVDDAVSFLLSHIPPQLHLVISSRSDPSLPLSTLRAQRHMNEIRAPDLRFTQEEIATLLNQTTGMDLPAESIAALETRTEGWIAGLQLAVISIQRLEHSEDVSEFVQRLTGSDRYILDYLTDQVLQHQPDHLQSFLLQTSVLDRLSAPLCDTIVDWELDISLEHGDVIPPSDPVPPSTQSQSILEHLDSSNLFTVPLDNERVWYRYHHLFGDLLRQRLRQMRPDLIRSLHRRAGEWYAHNGGIEEAVEHSLAAAEFEQAARMIEEIVEDLWERGQRTRLLRWLNTLPAEHVSSSPLLCLHNAWVLFVSGQAETAAQWLQAADKALATAPEPSPRQPTHFGKTELQGRLAAIKAFIATIRGDAHGINEFSRQALELLPDEALAWRGFIGIPLGYALIASGDLEAARQTYLDAVAINETAGNVYYALLARAFVAVVLLSQGKLRQAYDRCLQTLELVNRLGMSQTAVAGWMYSLRGEIQAERHDLDDALHYTAKGTDLCRRLNHLPMLGWCYLRQIRALYAARDIAQAREIIRQAQDLKPQPGLPPWIMNIVESYKARIWLLEGDLDAASQWVRERGLHPNDPLTWTREPEHLVLARILIAQDGLDEANGLLARLLESQEEGSRILRMIEVLVLRSLAFQALGNTAQATESLERALALAEPEDCMRALVDAGEPLVPLLRHIASRGTATDYIARLLSLLETVQPTETALLTQQLVDPLSERELEVLRLITAGLSNQEIAQELIIAVGTVKAHTSAIYRKLDVRGRAQAIVRSRELGII
jgi:LuxR family maltose regulon positive regulatory protein